MKKLEPRRRSLRTSRSSIVGLAAILVSVLALTVGARSQQANNRSPELPSPLCDGVQVPEGNQLAFRVYALGYQIYRWDGTKWVFVAPDATLYADAGHHGIVGRHYAGPTWESNSGSAVVGTRIAACTPDTASIPWLLLAGTSSHGPGIFDDVKFIQRVDTVGGIAPTTPGLSVGQSMPVPYMAEYYFYRTDPNSAANNQP